MKSSLSFKSSFPFKRLFLQSSPPSSQSEISSPPCISLPINTSGSNEIFPSCATSSKTENILLSSWISPSSSWPPISNQICSLPRISKYSFFPLKLPFCGSFTLISLSGKQRAPTLKLPPSTESMMFPWAVSTTISFTSVSKPHCAKAVAPINSIHTSTQQNNRFISVSSYNSHSFSIAMPCLSVKKSSTEYFGYSAKWLKQFPASAIFRMIYF